MRSEPRVNGVQRTTPRSSSTSWWPRRWRRSRAPPTEPTVDALLDEVAERLKARPDREVLLDRLRDKVLGPPTPSAPAILPDPAPPSGDR